MLKLRPQEQAYAWGSHTLIQGLRDQPEGDSPLAELWYGAHPAAPSATDEGPLDAVLAQDPAGELGSAVQEEYGDRLPFLLKILAADQPLSLQAHPSLTQAREGFARENAQGVPVEAPNRNYRDDNHKPELLVALTEFHALAGFRPLAATRELFAALACPELDHYVSAVDARPEAEEASLRALFTTWITIPVASRAPLIEAIVASAQRLLATPEQLPTWQRPVLSNIVELQRLHPNDVGILGALLLNYVILQPGEGLFLAAGNLHAYVRGMGVEIMANSDNVLRGGLTPKHVDIPELVHVLEFRSLDDPKVGCHEGRYAVPTHEFALQRLNLSASTHTGGVEVSGPLIVLCTKGQATVRRSAEDAGNKKARPGESQSRESQVSLGPAEAVWVPVSDGVCEVSGSGEVFLASVGR